jgi:hypothetical protein
MFFFGFGSSSKNFQGYRYLVRGNFITASNRVSELILPIKNGKSVPIRGAYTGIRFSQEKKLD